MESTTQRTLLAGKIHRATVAQCELHCKRSCAVDDALLEASGIAEFEQIHIWNTDNSARFQTYTIRAQRGGGTISVNGSVARQAAVGDQVIIAAFGQLLADQVAGFQPKLVFFDEANRIGGERPTIAVQGL